MNALALADFNGDGKLDAMACGTTSPGGGVFKNNDFAVALGNGDGTFAAPKIFAGEKGAECASTVVSDFNGDGKMDVALAGWQINRLCVLFGNGDDLDDDGKPDIFALGLAYINKGDGTFKVVKTGI